MFYNEKMLTRKRSATADKFYGQEKADFDRQVAVISKGDPRLVAVFQNTRNQYLQSAQIEEFCCNDVHGS